MVVTRPAADEPFSCVQLASTAWTSHGLCVEEHDRVVATILREAAEVAVDLRAACFSVELASPSEDAGPSSWLELLSRIESPFSPPGTVSIRNWLR